MEPGPARKDDIGLCHQLHRRFRAVVTERTYGKPVTSGKAVIVLIVVANRSIELLGQGRARVNRVSEDDARARQNDGKLCFRQQFRRLCDGAVAAGRALEFDDGRQVDIDDLGPEIARNVDLRRSRKTFRFQNDAIENFCDARSITHLFLITDHVAEQSHLLHFLEAALADRLVRRLRRHDQHRGVIPVSRLYRRDEARNAGAILGDGHCHLSRRPRVAVADQAAIGFVRDVPKGDAGLRKKIGDRHEGRADDAERMLDTVHLQDLNKGFFGGHFHGASSYRFQRFQRDWFWTGSMARRLRSRNKYLNFPFFPFHIPEFLLFLSHERLVWRIETSRFAGGSSRNAASCDARRIGSEHWRAEADDASLALLPRGGRLPPKDARRPQI